ncbi:AsmA family protein [Mesorhizobium sp. YIM 152430]|uniref:AsmA family protein n=1 Tax=Mesorhizobium sp. YIM 152430 TaxID=3031761 RepID=UPI0023DCDE3C|nr:AsmA family protein [Mesorhizobium sp. YIM 152430]MDF1598160.1 AsmA family protein [Mesorhizobium sp. YIM 152430]
MQGQVVRRTIIGLAALIVAGVGLVLALPWIASTQLVRDRIAYELSAWSGYRVQLSQAPRIDVWPTFSAHLSNVALYEWGGHDSRPVLEAERVDIDLSALAALRGDVVFSKLALEHPLLRLTKATPVFDLPPLPGGGRMSRAIDTASQVVSANAVDPDLSGLPRDAFGQVTFNDGRIAVVEEGEDQVILSGLTGQIGWPALDRPATLTANGVWRSEAIRVEASSAQPLLLLAGGTSPVRLSLDAAPAKLRFDGAANLSANSFFDGQASFETPSLRRALEWSRTDIAAGQTIGAAKLSGRITGSAERLQIEEAALDLAGSPGTGVLELSTGGATPTIAGSIAFDQLNLGTFLAAFTPQIDKVDEAADLIYETAARQLNLDLRLSARQAQLGDFALAGLAATAQLKNGNAAFDISDASAFGGTIQAGIRIEPAGRANEVELRFLASEIDVGAMTLQAGAKRFVPQTRGNLSAILRGKGNDWNTVISTSEGTLTANFGPGDIVGIDVNAFLARAAEGRLFPLSEVAEGAMPIRGLQFSAAVGRGLARIDTGSILLEGRRAGLNGIVPLAGRALALSGDIAPVDGQGQVTGEAVKFFVGGGWDEPFISPMIVNEAETPPEDAGADTQP